jgi:hypothetical protein
MGAESYQTATSATCTGSLGELSELYLLGSQLAAPGDAVERGPEIIKVLISPSGSLSDGHATLRI